MTLNTGSLRTLEEVRAFLEGTAGVGFEAPAEAARYDWIAATLRQFSYARVKRPDKALVRQFVRKVSSSSRAQLNRLIAQWEATGGLSDRRDPPARPFATRYSEADVRLLAQLDELHQPPSGRNAGQAARGFTKSRARRTNDNALVESKNGSVVRKHLGYAHIPGRFAQAVNAYTREQLTPYLNFHRPCFFPETAIDEKGRHRKRYPYAAMMTPYDKLKSLPDAPSHLKAQVSFAGFDRLARTLSDNEAAAQLNAARRRLFALIHATAKAA